MEHSVSQPCQSQGPHMVVFSSQGPSTSGVIHSGHMTIQTQFDFDLISIYFYLIPTGIDSMQHTIIQFDHMLIQLNSLGLVSICFKTVYTNVTGLILSALI